MDAAIKAQWIRALRSGEYQQGRGWLTTVTSDGTERDCCLGVLCKLARDAGVSFSVELKAGMHGGPNKMVYGGEHYSLPREVQEWARLSKNDPAVTVDGADSCLSECNDGRDQGEAVDGSAWTAIAAMDFDAIADLIESQL